jgi:arylsulfatase A-like enzyme
MDCVRAQDFYGGIDPVPGLTNTEALAKEGVSYPYAVSPETWTLPSHVSIVTGLYPWQHNVRARRRLYLDPAIPTLASVLTSLGFKSLLASSNAFLSPETGFTVGFDKWATGKWWESFIRRVAREARIRDRTESLTTESQLTSFLPRRLFCEFLERYPVSSDLIQRFFGGLLGTEAEPAVSPWIESVFRKWIEGRPRGQPIFAMINLMDCHDPYLPASGQSNGFLDWLGQTSVSQQPVDYLKRRRKVFTFESQILRRLYRDSIREADLRVGNIVQILRDVNRWDNTLLILTSDHGQALLERGYLFHGMRVDEEITRIPLMVKFPKGRNGGAQCNAWASLIDVVPTVAETVGVAWPTPIPGVNLDPDSDACTRDRPVVSANGGIVNPTMARTWIPPEMIDDLDRVRVAMYKGGRKLLLEWPPSVPKAYDLSEDPGQVQDRWPDWHEELNSLRTQGENIARAMAETGVAERELNVSTRLKSWGYV